MKVVMATGTFDILHPGHGLYLEESKKLGGKDCKLVVIVARDSTVRDRKRIPIIDENQRLEMIKMLKPVDKAYLGHKTDMFKIVEEINPDIIAIGSDQSFNLENIKNQLEKRNIEAEVIRISDYRKAKLDSTCKIIRKIKQTDFEEKNLKDC
ncbi:D-beta-D-heptose 1-phosphate adenylyltransferase [Methanobrevibacter cuticularis]|uniref:FAD synthase n=1 Tax=Methanobrevibacter cuticularis TaxID=47311 RepID=A0A166CXU6_9EURY|nr:adenylyltransferase/cytidyltransferase family protein [Methanobrevibacter cuticularis]KZX14978.1 D-beta-D-heptose 1-phosphate adenylyltransferase [Methanobrevibacter cuticularis]